MKCPVYLLLKNNAQMCRRGVPQVTANNITYRWWHHFRGHSVRLWIVIKNLGQTDVEAISDLTIVIVVVVRSMHQLSWCLCGK